MLPAAGCCKMPAAYLIRKSSFLSLVPFISSRIQIGSMPRPDHFTDLFLRLWYFGFALARFVKSGLPAGSAMDSDTRNGTGYSASGGTGYSGSSTGYSASPDDRDAVTNATGINV